MAGLVEDARRLTTIKPKAERAKTADPVGEALGKLDPGPPRFWRWVGRNWWRWWLGVAVDVVLLGWVLVVGPLFGGRRELFPFGDLTRGLVNRLSVAAGSRPRFVSRFDTCWAGGVPKGEWRGCLPGEGEVLRLLMLVGVAVGVLVFWWRASEMQADGDGRVAAFVSARRRNRLVATLRDQWRASVLMMRFTAPPSWWWRWLGRVSFGLIRPKRARPMIELRDARFDLTGSVIGDARYAKHATDVDKFERDRTVLTFQTGLEVTLGQRRRVPAQPAWVKRLPWWVRWAYAPVVYLPAVAAGTKAYRVSPWVELSPHPTKGSRWRQVRLAMPSLDADLLVCDLDPAPDERFVRVALGTDVVLWDRDEYPHLGVYGPTRRGKGHILRHVAWQLIQGGQLVVMIDGQAGPEHALFDGLPNYWWFDPDAYQARWGNGLAPWVTSSLTADQVDKVLDEVLPEDRERIAHLVYVRNQLSAVIAMGRARNQVARRNLGGGWHEWSKEDQEAFPRINVMFDEANTLLAKGGGPGSVGEVLRREIGAAMGVLLFGGAKYGIHITLAAQVLYSASYMARGMYAQVGFVLAVGNMPPQHQTMTTQAAPFPSTPDRKGYGIAVPYAHPPAEAVRFPPMHPWAVKPGVDRLLAEVAAGRNPP